MISNKKHFILNLSSTYLSIIISAILSFITVPIALSYWGNTIYGIWTIILSFASYITASGLGIDVATGNLMAKNPGINQKKAILRKGIFLMLVSCVIILMLFYLLNTLNPEWYKIIGKMDDDSYLIAKPAIIIFIISTIFLLPFSVISSSFGSIGRAYINTYINMFEGIGNLIILLVIRKIQGNLWQYVLFINAEKLILGIIKILLLFFYINDLSKSHELKEYPLEIIDNKYKTIIKTGINLSLYGLPIMLVPNFSNLIISNVIDINSLVPYSIEYKLFTVAMGIVMAINLAAAPLLGKEFGQQNWSWLINKINTMKAVTTFLGICLANGMIIFSRFVIILWTKNSYNYPGDLITSFLSLWVFLYCINNVSLVIINSFNYTDKIWLVSWIESALFLLISIILIKYIGIVAIPLGLFLSVLLISCFTYMKIIQKRSEKRINLFSLSYFKGLIVITLFCIIHKILNNFELNIYIEFLISLLIYIISVFIAFLTIEKNERIQLKSFIQKAYDNIKLKKIKRG